MTINQFLAHSSNFTGGRTHDIKYLVIHYTGNNGDTAKGNCNYFSGANRNASAHYFVDETSIYQSVLDTDTAWAVGANSYKHNDCRNHNSISIELCARENNSGYYFLDATIENAIQLVATLAIKYNIKSENILRHYDVTGKLCPRPFIESQSDWSKFKSSVVNVMNTSEDIRYNTLAECPDWAQQTIIKAISKEIFADENNLNLSKDMLRMFVFWDRLGYL